MIVQKKFNTYPLNLLPCGFDYPIEYLKISANPKLVHHDKDHEFRWWFEDFGTESADLAYKYRNYDTPTLNLIPFAQNGEWIANFDGNDQSGNPKVVVVDHGDLPFHMIFEDFSDWLTKAEQDYW